MEQAKYNLINEYFLVGVTEELEDFIMLLEAALPRFFRGATELYRTGISSPLHYVMSLCVYAFLFRRKHSVFSEIFIISFLKELQAMY